MMDFDRNFNRALELLPPEQRDNFMRCLFGSMAVYLDDEHLGQCIERSLDFAQGFKPSLELGKR